MVSIGRCLGSAIVVVVAAATLAAPAPAADASGRAYSAAERAALKVVNDWDQAWKSKDARQIGQYMADDVEFDDPNAFGRGTVKGRDQFIRDYDDPKTMMKGIEYYDILSQYAAGGPDQTVVVQKRRDHFVMNGRHMSLSFVGFFVVKDGKIVQWRDIPLQKLPSAPAAAAAPSK